MIHIHSGRYKIIPDKNSIDIHFYKNDVKQNKNEVIHNILLLDCSISMGCNMKQMRKEVSKLIERFKENSYVSIICYSGHGQSYILSKCIRCDKTSYKMNGIFNKINNIKTMGLTVMSEPLNTSLDICLELHDTVDMSNVILFTDGCIVTCDMETEENTCIKLADILNSKNTVVSTIGFGQYYDMDFLSRLASRGLFCHIDDIAHYNEIVNKIIENSKNKSNSMQLSSESKLMNITTGEFGYSISVYPKDIVASIQFELDVEKAEIQTPYKDMSDIIDGFYYILAKHNLQHDNIDTYEDIVKMLLGDIYLYRQTKNTYSFKEKGQALQLVNDCIFEKSKRFISGRKLIIDNDEEQLSVLEVLSNIMQDKDSQLYWNKDTKYNYTGMKTESIDNDTTFHIDPCKKLFKIIDCSISDKKLNISVNVVYEGYVQDSASILKKEAHIFRRYNIINNGNLNVRYIYAQLSEDMFNTLVNNRINVTLYDMDSENGIFQIDLDGLKTANKRIFKSVSKEDIIDYMTKLEDLKCKQYTLNKMIKEILGSKSKLDFDESKSVVDKEICKKLNIDENNHYKTNVQVYKPEQFEVYPALHCEWTIKFDKNYSKEKYLKEANNVMNKIKENQRLDVLLKFREDLKKNIRTLSFRINCIRIASAMINKPVFIFDLVVDKPKTINDKIMDKNMVVGGTVELSERIFDNTIFTQKKWIQLLKCS